MVYLTKWIEITTPYRTIKISPDGRQVIDEIHQSVKKSPHTTNLINYVTKLHERGVDRINCDHVYFDFLDRSMNLNRGKRRLDIIYYKNNQLFECELKGPREVGLQRTWEQVNDMSKECNVLTLLVPLDKMEFCKEQLNLWDIEGVVVDTYEN